MISLKFGAPTCRQAGMNADNQDIKFKHKELIAKCRSGRTSFSIFFSLCPLCFFPSILSSVLFFNPISFSFPCVLCGCILLFGFSVPPTPPKLSKLFAHLRPSALFCHSERLVLSAVEGSEESLFCFPFLLQSVAINYY